MVDEVSMKLELTDEQKAFLAREQAFRMLKTENIIEIFNKVWDATNADQFPIVFEAIISRVWREDS